jgi:hypothetical protein
MYLQKFNNLRNLNIAEARARLEERSKAMTKEHRRAQSLQASVENLHEKIKLLKTEMVC